MFTRRDNRTQSRRYQCPSESLRFRQRPLQSRSYLIAELIWAVRRHQNSSPEETSPTVKENESSERAICQAERKAEDSFQNRDPLACRDLLVRNRENDKSLKYYNFNGCRSQSDVVQVLEEELLADE
jgi:hypothetical protein